MWDGALQNFCKFLKKGSSIEVTGYYEDRAYTSQKTGQPEVGRDINARMIDFTIGGEKRQEEGRQQPQQPQQQKPKDPTPKAEQPQAPQAPTEAQAEGDDDDLPF